MPIYRSHILICGGTGCTSSGAGEVTEAFKKAITEKGLADEVLVVPTGCHGMCEMGMIGKGERTSPPCPLRGTLHDVHGNKSFFGEDLAGTDRRGGIHYTLSELT
jgi:hypothetical protein